MSVFRTRVRKPLTLRGFFGLQYGLCEQCTAMTLFQVVASAAETALVIIATPYARLMSGSLWSEKIRLPPCNLRQSTAYLGVFSSSSVIAETIIPEQKIMCQKNK